MCVYGVTAFDEVIVDGESLLMLGPWKRSSPVKWTSDGRQGRLMPQMFAG